MAAEQTPLTVDDLQRELLAICKGGSFAETWRKVNAIVEWPSLRREISKVNRIREIRRQIHALNPSAALYFGWAGPTDDTAAEFFEQLRRSTNGVKD